MRKFLLILPLTALIAGCQTQGQTTMAGAAAGAALGSVVAGDNNRLEGAVIGGIAGAAAGSLIGQDNQGRCVYRRNDGSKFVAAC